MGAAAGMDKRKVGFVGVGLILTPLLLAATGCGYIESRKQSIAEGSNQRGLEWAQNGEYVPPAVSGTPDWSLSGQGRG